jgi:hypothetical protein
MLHFYDGQIRRYLTQLVRMFSNFTVREGDGKIRQTPVLYGDLTRQVANIIRENSESKIPSVPRMSLYITGLEIDRERTSDSSYVSKINVRERAYNKDGEEYLNTQGKNYTVERLMPTPYKLTVNLDIWSSNTDQKLQLLEQIGQLFNPSLELQTTDNFIDWTSITTVELTNIVFSSRSIPVGTESEIDIATLTFITPIYISPPVKVKRLGVITNIVTSVFNEQAGTIELGLSAAQNDSGLYDSSKFTIEESRTVTDLEGNIERVVDYGEFPNVGTGEMDINVSRTIKSNVQSGTFFNTSYLNLGLYVIENKAYIVDQGKIGEFLWRDYFNFVPNGDCYKPGATQIHLTLADNSIVIGYTTINPTNPDELTIEWDLDTLPSSTVIEGPARDPNAWSSLDSIIDPLRWDPNQAKTQGLRLLLLSKIGNEENTDGADAWKNSNGTDFVAGENDIVEWTGTEWQIVFDASENTEVTYITNLTTGAQFRWTGEFWTKSFEGEYSAGAWRVVPNA